MSKKNPPPVRLAGKLVNKPHWAATGMTAAEIIADRPMLLFPRRRESPSPSFPRRRESSKARTA